MPGICSRCCCSKGAQAGLSWITVLKKRERYRQVLHGFDPERLARLTDEEIEVLMQDPGSSATASSSRPCGRMPRPGCNWRIR